MSAAPDGSPNTLFVVGAGSGVPGMLTGESRNVIGRCRFFCGGKRLLELAGEIAADVAGTHVINADLEAVRDFVAGRLKEGDVCVLTSGDPGCFSILPFLKEHFPENIRVITGISSVQLLAARLGVPWQGWLLRSLHGRGAAVQELRPAGATVYFCDKTNPPQAVARLLLQEMPGCPAAVGARLGGREEILFQGSLQDVAAGKFPGHSLLLVEPKQAGVPRPAATAPGIPDDLWLRRDGIPLSKSEVRAVLLSKAEPAGRSVIWDLGAGTGSYGIECALLEPGAQVISLDKNPAACDLIAANAGRFRARVEVVCAEAPEGLETLAPPELVIIGGSGGMLAPVFKAAVRMLEPGGRMVVTALLEETRKAAHELFAGSGLANRSATRVAIARGEGHKWTEHNPVTIFTGDKQ